MGEYRRGVGPNFSDFLVFLFLLRFTFAFLLFLLVSFFGGLVPRSINTGREWRFNSGSGAGSDKK